MFVTSGSIILLILIYSPNDGIGYAEFVNVINAFELLIAYVTIIWN